MNEGRVRHLLLFELKRLKWLVTLAWISLAMAFAPRLLEAVGIWKMDSHHAEELFGGTGTVFFAISGLFIAIWAGLFGTKLVPTRPIRRGEILVIRISVLFGVLVIPLLLLTLTSLWLHGFSSGVIWRNVSATALAVIPVWLGLALFSRFAGSLKNTIAGLTLLGFVIVIADSNQIRGLAEPWANVVGSRLSIHYLVASWVTTVLLGVSLLLVKKRDAIVRMAIATLSVFAGWGTMPWVKDIEKKIPYRSKLSESPQWTGRYEISNSKGGINLQFYCESKISESNRFVFWQVLDGFEGENGLRAKSPDHFGPDLHHGIQGEKVERVAKDLLEGGFRHSDSQGFPHLRTPNLTETDLSTVSFTVPRELKISEDQPLAGTLAGAVCEIEQLVNTPIGTEAKFQLGDLQGEIHWTDPEIEFGSPTVSVDIRYPLMNQFGYDHSWSSQMGDWIFLLNFPKARIVVEGRRESSGRGFRIGGVQSESIRVRFHPSKDINLEAIWEEKPQLTIYRIKIVETGYCETTIPKFEENSNTLAQSYFFSLLEGPDRSGKIISPEVFRLRPDSSQASRAEVGAWMRKLRFKYQYRAASRDLTDYADKWGDLLIRSGVKANGHNSRPLVAAFVTGATDESQEELISALGEAEWVPGAIVLRGWEESSREKVTELLAGGNRDAEILKLASKLKIPEVSGIFLEGLTKNEDPKLYDLARSLPNTSEAFDEALDQRLEFLERQSQYDWSYRQGYQFLPSRWFSLLLQGRRKDLDKFIWWINRAIETEEFQGLESGGQIPFVQDRALELLLASKNLKADYFEWDPALRKWAVSEKVKWK